ncbi:unnamed protein product [Schistocephalus solidus]|uniref:Helicase C-terminal domain-containing protein n=1 Tax=Schistocephalus solidus TaxID=70667 RepID=A0A183SN96_SCHSO|nr:unnamed protein product [Schistocephalus solidus]
MAAYRKATYMCQIVIVSRANFIANQLNQAVRIVGLSTALANAVDMAAWLRVPLSPESAPDQGQSGLCGRGLFNFRPSVRPVPLEVHIQGYPGRHYCPRMATMNRPIFQAIQTHSASKPVLVFVASRRQTRRTAFDLISYSQSASNPQQWLHMNVQEMENLAATIVDSNLQLTLPYGIGLHHAGLRDRDRRIVEELFVNQKIQARALKQKLGIGAAERSVAGVVMLGEIERLPGAVLIATSTLAWGVNFPAHLVIIKGTEYFDGKTKRYVDFPITGPTQTATAAAADNGDDDDTHFLLHVDVLQMMGRAGRPQFDNEGKAVVMVQDTKKAFYKRFLYEPFPVESCLLQVLADYLNAEIATGSVSSMQSALECITWTFFFRRLMMNPNYYHLEETTADAVNRYLSEVVSGAVNSLIENGCVEQDPEDPLVLLPTSSGRLASFYYLSHKTIGLFTATLTATTTIAELLYILSLAEEFALLPVRHAEDETNAILAREMPLPVKGAPESPHTKAHILLQAYLSRRTLELPISDYVTDTKSVLDQAPRVLQTLSQFPVITVSLDLVGPDPTADSPEAGDCCRHLPILGLDIASEQTSAFSESALPVFCDTDYALSVNIHSIVPAALAARSRAVANKSSQGATPSVKSREPGWILVLGAVGRNNTGADSCLLALRKVSGSQLRHCDSSPRAITVSFRLDSELFAPAPAVGRITDALRLHLFVMSDTYLALDQQLPFGLCVQSSPLRYSPRSIHHEMEM